MEPIEDNTEKAEDYLYALHENILVVEELTLGVLVDISRKLDNLHIVDSA